VNPQKEKILVLTSSFPINENSNIGGGVFVYNLCERLSEEYEIHVLTPRIIDSEKESRFNAISIKRYSFLGSKNLIGMSGIAATLSKKKPAYIFVPFFLISQLLSLKKYIRENNISIIHAHWLIPQGIVAVFYKRIFNKEIKIICTSHGSDLNMNFGWIGKQILKSILQHTDSLTVVSQNLREKAIALGYKKKIEIIPMGIDTKRFNYINENGIKKKYRIKGDLILFVGNLIEVKGVEYLLRAIPEILLSKPNTTLLFVGDGILKERLNAISGELNIKNNIVFTGSISNNEMPNYFSAADIVVMPSLNEGLGLVWVEAMACKTLVIASDIDVFKHHIKHYENGFLVPVKNSQAIADMVLEVFNNLNKMDEIRENARKYVVSNFDWEIVTSKFVNILSR